MSNLKTRALLAFPIAALLLIAPPLRADDAPTPASDDKHVDPEKAGKIGDLLAPSFVHVEYTLQYDRGEPPVAGTWWGMYRRGGPEQVIRDDRPYEVSGFLIGNDTVISPDQMIHPRFIKKIAVRLGDEVVDATPASYVKDHSAITLKLAKPLKGGKPLTFDKIKAGPYLAISYGEGESDSEWIMTAQPLGGTSARTDSGKRYMMVPGAALIVDKAGAPVGMAMRERMAADDSWKGSPIDWPAYSAEEMAKLTAATQSAAQHGLLSVTLNFRSPKAKPGGRESFMSREPGDQQNAAQRYVVGVAIDPQTILVLAELKANVTARLEKIKVMGADGKAINAKFKLSLLDYGAFVATLEKPLSDIPPISKSELPSTRYQALPAAQILMQGEKRVEYFDHRRLTQFFTGWHKQIYPEMGNGLQNLILFDPSGAILAIPVARREREQNADRWDGGQEHILLTPATYVLAALADPAKNGDPANVPLSEQEENRLAWLGVELQALTPDLARANDVSHLTNDGRTGAVVTYIYPDSPAAKAGIEAGDVLLRINVEGQPKPLDVTIEPSQFGDQPFPWEQLDRLPEQYFDQIPQPWPAAENSLSRMLTDLGFGKKFTVEYARAGKQAQKDLVVTQSPPSYDAAPKYKSDALGITVRDLTYEVRRYFQKTDDEAGVIISKIEMGSKASTAGLKPYEVVTAVNDVAVNNVKDFEKQIKDQKQLRLSIKRMTKGRQVKIKLPEKGEEPEKPAKAPAAEETTDDAAPAEGPSPKDEPKSLPKRIPAKAPAEEPKQ